MTSFVIHTADAAKAVRDLEPAFLAAARKVLGQTTAFALEIARRSSKFKDRSGKLRRSMYRGDTGMWTHFISAGGEDAPWGKFVEDGTASHVIEVTNASALAFVWNGVPVFFRRVHHPGTKPTHFMLEARDQSEDVMHRFMESGLAEVFR